MPATLNKIPDKLKAYFYTLTINQNCYEEINDNPGNVCHGRIRFLPETC